MVFVLFLFHILFWGGNIFIYLELTKGYTRIVSFYSCPKTAPVPSPTLRNEYKQFLGIFSAILCVRTSNCIFIFCAHSPSHFPIFHILFPLLFSLLRITLRSSISEKNFILLCSWNYLIVCWRNAPQLI